MIDQVSDVELLLFWTELYVKGNLPEVSLLLLL